MSNPIVCRKRIPRPLRKSAERIAAKVFMGGGLLLGILLTCLLTGCAGLSNPVSSVTLRGRYERRTDGYFQTPRGGKSFTTSKGRPTWDEADMEQEFRGRLDINLETEYLRARIYLEPSCQRSSRVYLHHTLVSAGAVFDAGELVEIEYDNDEYGFMVYPRILEQSWLDERVTLSPFIGGYYFDKRMSISDHDYVSERTRGRTAPTVGIEGKWVFARGAETQASIFGSCISAFKDGYLNELGVRLETDLGNWTLIGEITGFNLLERDEQETPNEDRRQGWRFALGVERHF